MGIEEQTRETLIHTPKIGEVVESGWKYAGISPSTRAPLFVAIVDEPIKKTFIQAENDALSLTDFFGYHGSHQSREPALIYSSLKRGNHDHGVRLPTDLEFRQLIQHRHEIGAFKESGGLFSLKKHFYWTCTPSPDHLSEDSVLACSFRESGKMIYEYGVTNVDRCFVRLVRS